MGADAHGRFIIVDPSLADMRGHHYQLTLNVAEAAKSAGAETIWLINATASDTMTAAHSRAMPFFSSGMYDAYSGTNQGTERSLTTSMADGLRRAHDQLDLGPADRLFFHTCDAATYGAVAAYIEDMTFEDIPHVHLCTPYDPVGVMPNRELPRQIDDAIDRLAFFGLIGTRIFLYAENDLLAAHLTHLWRTPVTPLNIPMPQYTATEREAAAEYKRDVLELSESDLIVTVLGSARVEKGFHLLPKIVEATHNPVSHQTESSADPSRIHFFLQATPQVIGREEKIQRAIDDLRSMNDRRVHLIEQSLGSDEYRNILLSSDVMLLPYERDKYRVRGSGVVSEAISAGVPIVATEGSYPGFMAERFGGRTGSAPGEFAHSIIDLLNTIDVWHEVHGRNIEDYCARHSRAAYFQQIASRDRQRTVPV